jgi:hypothetical protein
MEDRIPSDAVDADCELGRIDPTAVENPNLRAALERLKERYLVEPHTAYYKKHTSHGRHAKGW